MVRDFDQLIERIKGEHEAALAALTAQTDPTAIYRAQGRVRLCDELLKSVEPAERRATSKAFT